MVSPIKLSSLVEQIPRQTELQRQVLVTPIILETFRPVIKGFQFDTYLLSGFAKGFHLGFEGDRCFRNSSNLKSCREFPEVIDDKLALELQLGRIKGPFNEPPFQNLQISPIGCVPKKAKNQYRLIQHLSYPKGTSINDSICEELSTVKYSTFDDAVTLVKLLGPNSLMAKTDIDSAFRIIPVHPDDHELLGFKWRGKFFYDTCLTMGCTSSCAIFDRFSSGLKWIAQNKLGISFILHILDDFLILGPANSEACLTNLNKFLSLCDTVGVPIKSEKTELPSTIMTFMGLELDSSTMEARLPYDKLVKVRELLERYKRCRKVELRDLQSLIGLLNFCCQVVRPGRSFLRRLIDLTKNVSYPKHKITLNKEGRRDLQAWSLFVEHFNGRHLLLDNRWQSSQSLHLYTDAAGAKGFAAIFQKSWFYGPWPANLAPLAITFKEMFPIVLAFEIWGPLMCNSCITLHSDNYAVVYILNKQSSKDPSIMSLVRRFVLCCMKHNILIKAIHIPGKENILPDLLSRFQVQEFRISAPHMDPEPTLIPHKLLALDI